MDKQKVILHNLAKHFGRNEAVFLQQLHYLLGLKKKPQADGQKWVYNTTERWQADHFPFISQRTVERTIANLEAMGLVESKQWKSQTGDHTKYYRINYDQIAGYEQQSGRLLLSGASTPFSSDLAAQVGVNAAIFVYQLQHWLQIEESHMQKNIRSNIYDGQYWQFSTLEHFREQMPWIKSVKTVQRLIARLEEVGVLSRVKARKGYRYSLVYDGLPMLRELAAPQGDWKYTNFKNSDREYELSHGDLHYLAKLFMNIFDFELDIYEDRSSLEPLRELVAAAGKFAVVDVIRESSPDLNGAYEWNELKALCDGIAAEMSDTSAPISDILSTFNDDDPNEIFSRAWFDDFDRINGRSMAPVQ